MKEYFRKPGYVDVNTFERFWSKFHHLNPQPKVYMLPAKTLFNKINDQGKKRDLIKGIEKSSLNAYDYIKSRV